MTKNLSTSKTLLPLTNANIINAITIALLKKEKEIRKQKKLEKVIEINSNTTK